MASKLEHPLVKRLHDLRNVVHLFASEEARKDAIAEIEETVERLQQLRNALASSSLDYGPHLQSVDDLLGFLKAASEDERLRVVLSWAKPTKRARPPRPKRQAVEIKSDLTNDEIRNLLNQSLSRKELEAIAQQKGLSTDKRNVAELREAILGFVDKQDNYAKLGSPR